MAGKVHHTTDDQILAEVIHWIMDGEALTTARERLLYGDEDSEGESIESECIQCQRTFEQPKSARRQRAFCEACR